MAFHVCWHCVISPCATGTVWQSPRGSIGTLCPTAEQLSQPWSQSFEETLDALGKLDRLFAEPDGSFVWRPGDAEQVDGQCYDLAGRLRYVELRGDVTAANIDRLHAAINPNRDMVLVQFTREGVFVAWQEWRSNWFAG